MISVQNISHSFQHLDVLKNISFNIPQGGFITITGPSGCGKSTLAKIIAGHINPSSGNIYLENQNITGLANKNIFLVHQESDLFPWLTVWNQIKIAQKTSTPREIQALIDLVKLTGFEHYYVKNLSGGMKKRLAIARSLAANPKLVILDEAFSSLDKTLREELSEELKNIWKKTNTTICLITHDEFDISHFPGERIQIEKNGTYARKN